MLPGDTTLKDLMGRSHGPGTVQWIGLRPVPGQAVQPVPAAELMANHGLAGDHRSRRGGGKRQVTLIQAEHLAVIASLCGRTEVTPELLRRNIVVQGINLLALVGEEFSIGDALLKGTGPCVPCSRMEQNLGHGGYNAVRGHGGITAMVIDSGTVRIGDPVLLLRRQRN